VCRTFGRAGGEKEYGGGWYVRGGEKSGLKSTGGKLNAGAGPQKKTGGAGEPGFTSGGARGFRGTAGGETPAGGCVGASGDPIRGLPWVFFSVCARGDFKGRAGRATWGPSFSNSETISQGSTGGGDGG